MSLLFRILSLYLFISAAFISHFAQSTPFIDDSDTQTWNDVNITVALTGKVDLYVPFTLRLDHDLRGLSEARVGGGLVFKLNKAIAITPFYTFIRYHNRAGRFMTENRLTSRFVYKFPTKGFAISHRSQFEYRVRSSRDLWRYRAAITIEKPLPEKWVSGLRLYVTEEPFFESSSGRFSRNLISFGVNKNLSDRVSINLYYLYQGDNFSHPSSLHVIGTSWKIRL